MVATKWGPMFKDGQLQVAGGGWPGAPSADCMAMADALAEMLEWASAAAIAAFASPAAPLSAVIFLSNCLCRRSSGRSRGRQARLPSRRSDLPFGDAVYLCVLPIIWPITYIGIMLLMFRNPL